MRATELRGLESRSLLGMRVDATSYEDATERIVRWARDGASRSVGIATVNNVMEAYDDPSYREVMNGADLVTPDGMPLVWGLRRLGVGSATRVYGPDLTPLVLAAAAREGLAVGFHGSTPAVLDAMRARLARELPALRVAYAVSPPFRTLTVGEEAQIARDIEASGAKIVFVGLGCPKQEIWMHEHRGVIPAVMVGVGAAFDFYAGTKRQAPRWMQRSSLEWVFRLATEPRRLWRRYLRHNPRFMVLFAKQLLRDRHKGDSRRDAAAIDDGSGGRRHAT